MTTKHSTDWRQSPSISSKKIYIRKFALFPRRLSDNTWIFFKHYFFIEICLHYADRPMPFRVEKASPNLISEEEYIFKKLANKLDN